MPPAARFVVSLIIGYGGQSGDGVGRSHGDRRIVAWSEHELNVAKTLAGKDPELVARFEARFANARAVAEY